MTLPELKLLTDGLYAWLAAEKQTAEAQATAQAAGFDAISKRVAALEAGSTTQAAQLATLVSQAASLVSQVAALTTRMAAMEGKAASYDAAIADLKAKVAALMAAPVPVPTPTPVPTAPPIAPPFYVYPDTVKWPAMLKVKTSFLVFNPSTGPNSVINSQYVAQVAAAKAAGHKVLVYVPSGYLDMFGFSNYPTVSPDGVKRDPANVQNILNEITKALGWYPCDGVFIDEMNNKALPEVLAAYTKIRDHIKSLIPGGMVILNPGALFPEAFMPLADVFMRFESSSAKYRTFVPPAWHANYAGKGRFWDCIHSMTPTEWPEILELAKKFKADHLWMTDDVMPNPYDSVPTFLTAWAAAK